MCRHVCNAPRCVCSFNSSSEYVNFLLVASKDRNPEIAAIQTQGHQRLNIQSCVTPCEWHSHLQYEKWDHPWWTLIPKCFWEFWWNVFLWIETNTTASFLRKTCISDLSVTLWTALLLLGPINMTSDRGSRGYTPLLKANIHTREGRGTDMNDQAYWCFAPRIRVHLKRLPAASHCAAPGHFIIVRS